MVSGWWGKGAPSTIKSVYPTFTNAAKDEIERGLLKRFSSLPSRVEVQTVHTFLLNEIIYPFSPFLISESYKAATTVNLNPRYKAKEIKRLKNMHVMHVDEVYAAARRCVDSGMSIHKNKVQQQKIQRVLKILSASIEKVFLDEIQDLYKTALNVFDVIGLNAVDVYMVGDPKQAISYPKDFENYLIKYQKEKNSDVKILPPNNVTRRVPNEILCISNQFCNEDQKQTSLIDKVGFVKFIDSKHPEYDSLLKNHIASTSIVCIDKKNGKYSTKNNIKARFDPEIENIIINECVNKDPEIFLKAAQIKFHKDVIKHGPKQAVNKFLHDHAIQYSAKTYARMMSMVNNSEDAEYTVSSIEAIKGLESDVCILILTPSTYKYLTQKNLKPGDRFNKEWKKIYVALTRAKSEFIIGIDYDIFKKSGIDIQEVKGELTGMGFCEIQA